MADHKGPLGCNTLPPHVLAHILSYVPLEVRMRDCACVNSKWHTAALQASHSMAVKGLTTVQAAGLAAWLQTYSTAAHVSRLDLHASNTSTTDDSASAAVGHALPAVKQLQSLRLQGGWRAAAVTQLSSMCKLQELDLNCHSSVLRAAIAALPTGLTSLGFGSSDNLWYLQLAGELHPDNRDATAELTAQTCMPKLQKLELRDPSVCISFRTLGGLPELRTCIVSFASIAAQGKDPTRLSALSALSSLQHLDLAGWLAPTCDGKLPVLDTSDCAALTASTQLTFLSLHKWQLQPELCSVVFPPKRQLPLLRELHLGPCFLQTPAATARVVSAAPSLTVLKVGCSDSADFYSEEHYLQEVSHSVSLDGVQQLQGLERVALEGVRVEDSCIWDVLARMTQLTELLIQQVSIPCLPGLLQLTTLKNLSSLSVDVVFNDEDEGFCDSSCRLSGTDTPVFLQLPAAVVKCAAEVFRMATNEDVRAAMPLLLEAAQALCPAALELYWSSEQQWQGVQDSSEEQRLSQLEFVVSTQPLLDQLEQSHVRGLQLVNTNLAAAVAAGCDLHKPLHQQQQSQVEAWLGSTPLAVAEGASDPLMQPWDEVWAAIRGEAQQLGELGSGWEVLRLQIAEGLGAPSTPFAREGQRLLAAVQDLKAETRRMCDHCEEQDRELDARLLRWGVL